MYVYKKIYMSLFPKDILGYTIIYRYHKIIKSCKITDI